MIRETDCSAGREDIPYMEVRAFKDGREVIEGLKDRITGRFIAEDIVDPDTGEYIIKKNRMITPRRAEAIMDFLEKTGRDSLKIRTILTCRCMNGICSKCYGANMATGQPVQIGEAVGIIAAQSIGEPPGSSGE